MTLTEEYKIVSPDNIDLVLFPEETVTPVSPEQVQSALVLLTESSESVNNRRQGQNNFFVSLNTILIGALGLLASQKEAGLREISIGAIFIVFGLIVNFGWTKLLKSYRVVSASKVELVRKLEYRLPIRVFTAQYGYTEDKRNGYQGLSSLEIMIAQHFLNLYWCLLVMVLIAAAVILLAKKIV